MRTKAIISGLKNSQKFRFILLAGSGEEVGLTLTVKQMSEQFATTEARVAVWNALEKLAFDRRYAKTNGGTIPSGIVTTPDNKSFRQVQVDLF